MKYWWLLGLSILTLAGCSTSVRAPVSPLMQGAVPSAGSSAMQAAPGTYVVRQGDTLYSIALAHDLDYKQLAQWNNLPSPDLIQVGQVLRLTPPVATAPPATPAITETSAAPAAPTSGVEVAPLTSTPAPEGQALGTTTTATTVGAGEVTSGVAAPGGVPVISSPVVSLLPYSEQNWNTVRQGLAAVPAPAASSLSGTAPEGSAAASTAPPPTASAPESGPIQWQWPAQGKIIQRFGQDGNKGIDIAGPSGSPVIAVAPGKVVYSGTGLRGYGLLIIIRHADDYLSAYAHNEKAMVKEGQQVQAGQVIALMGDTDSKQVELHFEIRRFGKALDPLKLLPPRS